MKNSIGNDSIIWKVSLIIIGIPLIIGIALLVIRYAPLSEVNDAGLKPEQIIPTNKTPTPTSIPTSNPQSTPTQTPEPKSQQQTQYFLPIPPLPLSDEDGEILIVQKTSWLDEVGGVFTQDQIERLFDIQYQLVIDHQLYLFGRVYGADDEYYFESRKKHEVDRFDELLEEYSYIVFFIGVGTEGRMCIEGNLFNDIGGRISPIVENWAVNGYDPQNMETLIELFERIQHVLDAQQT